MNESQLAHEPSASLMLTATGFQVLQLELEHLTMVKRPEIADRIRESQQHGEFSEDNSELDEVKFEQAMVETRIAELKTIFSHAAILEDSQIPTDRVGIGSLATVTDLEFDDQFTVRLVTSVEADPNKDLLSSESPMGQALYDAAAGEQVVFDAPDGKKKYRVDAISK